MAKIITPLTDTKCNNAKPQLKDYKLFDGGGLYLLVKKNNTKTWQIKFKKANNSISTISIGNYPIVSLKEAREQRESTKLLLKKGLDPVNERKKGKIANSNNDTFSVIAYDWIEQTSKHKKWNTEYIKSTTRAFENYIFPKIGNKPVQTITTRELIFLIQEVISKGVLKVASQLKQNTISIMRHALYKGLIDINPALDLAGLTINSSVKHRSVIALENLTELINKIQNYNGRPVIKYALLINLNIFIRASELAYALWDEIDLKNKLWTIPPKRKPIIGVKYSDRGAKMNTPHLIPLSDQVIKLLTELHQYTGHTPYVFTTNSKRPIHYLTPKNALRNIGYTNNELSLHGFRTLACSTLLDSGLFTKDAIERQMSHQERNNVRAAYIHKAKHLEERINIMQWWSDYIDHVKDNGYIPPYEFKNLINH